MNAKEFVSEKESKLTRKSTDQAVRLFNETMLTVANEKADRFIPLHDIDIEELTKEDVPSEEEPDINLKEKVRVLEGALETAKTQKTSNSSKNQRQAKHPNSQ